MSLPFFFSIHYLTSYNSVAIERKEISMAPPKHPSNYPCLGKYGRTSPASTSRREIAQIYCYQLFDYGETKFHIGSRKDQPSGVTYDGAARNPWLSETRSQAERTEDGGAGHDAAASLSRTAGTSMTKYLVASRMQHDVYLTAAHGSEGKSCRLSEITIELGLISDNI